MQCDHGVSLIYLHCACIEFCRAQLQDRWVASSDGASFYGSDIQQATACGACIQIMQILRVGRSTSDMSYCMHVQLLCVRPPRL